MPIITLTTDFEESDGYAGAVKGAILRLAPGSTVIDLAHGVPRHDIAHAAWVLATAAFEFPRGTIHVAVVDPGVGSRRAEVIVAAHGHWFVGPDNGVFAHVASVAPVATLPEAQAMPLDDTPSPVDGAWRITSAEFRSETPSATFHGRDVFAPAAAALARGVPVQRAGPPTTLLGHLPWTRMAGPDEGAVVHVDVYGNLVSNVRCTPGVAATVRIAGRELRLSRTYEDVGREELIAYVGSAGTVEVAVREGDAARALAVTRGEPVLVELDAAVAERG